MHDRFVLLTGRRDLRMDQSLVLEAWTNEFAALKVAYEAKEEFFGIWETAAVHEPPSTRYSGRPFLPAMAGRPA